MAKPSTKVAWDPTSCLAIQDIYLWGSSLSRHSEYQSHHEPNTVIQGMREIEAQRLSVTDFDGESYELLRAIVKLGIRAVVPSEHADKDEAAIEILHELTASFAVDYRIDVEPPEEVLQDFFQFNCVHNVWPFWRQHVYETLKKASLPLVEVPFFSGRKVLKKTKSTARNAMSEGSGGP